MPTARGNGSGDKVCAWLLSTRDSPSPPVAKSGEGIELCGRQVNTTVNPSSNRNARSELPEWHNYALMSNETRQQDLAALLRQCKDHAGSDDSSIIHHTVPALPAHTEPIFEKRARNKTRPNKYEIKPKERKRRPTGSGKKEREDSKKQARKATEPLYLSHNFNPSAVLAERISLPRALRPGVFGNSRNAAESDVLDLSFPDTVDFRSYKANKRASASQKTADRQREHVSSFFETTKNDSRAQRLPSSDSISTEGGSMKDPRFTSINQPSNDLFTGDSVQARGTQSVSRCLSPSIYRQSVAGTLPAEVRHGHARSNSFHSTNQTSDDGSNATRLVDLSEASGFIETQYRGLLEASGVFANTGIEILKDRRASSPRDSSVEVNSYVQILETLRNDEPTRVPTYTRDQKSKHIIIAQGGTCSSNETSHDAIALPATNLSAANEALMNESRGDDNKVQSAHEAGKDGDGESRHASAAVETRNSSVSREREPCRAEDLASQHMPTRKREEVSSIPLDLGRETTHDDRSHHELYALLQRQLHEQTDGGLQEPLAEQDYEAMFQYLNDAPFPVSLQPLEPDIHEAGNRSRLHVEYSWLREPQTTAWRDSVNVGLEAREPSPHLYGELEQDGCAGCGARAMSFFHDGNHWHHQGHSLAQDYTHDHEWLDHEYGTRRENIQRWEQDIQNSPFPNHGEVCHEPTKLDYTMDEEPYVVDGQAHSDGKWDFQNVANECQDMFDFWRPNRFAGL